MLFGDIKMDFKGTSRAPVKHVTEGGTGGAMPPNEKADMNLPPAGLLAWRLKIRFLKEDI